MDVLDLAGWGGFTVSNRYFEVSDSEPLGQTIAHYIAPPYTDWRKSVCKPTAKGYERFLEHIAHLNEIGDEMRRLTGSGVEIIYLYRKNPLDKAGIF